MYPSLNSWKGKVATKRYIKRDDSKDTLRLFVWNKDQATVYPDFSFNAVMSMVDSDPVARGALNHFVDKCMEGDINIVKKATGKIDKQFEMTLNDKYMFRTKVLRPLFRTLKMYNNAYIEIVKDLDNVTKSINVIDPNNMEPITKPNGDPIKYKSKRHSPETGKPAEWTKDEIVWVKYGDRAQGMAPVDLKALYETLLAKEYVRRYVTWLWKTGQYRVLYNAEGASNQDIEDFLVYARKHDHNFMAPFMFKGKLEAKIIRDIKETENITRLLEYYDSQILILLRIPPIDAGIPDASGRSNSDAQSNNLSTHITSFKKLVEDKISFELFPKMSKGNNILRFAPNDRFSEHMVFENLQIMQSVGMTPKAMEEYLQDRGMYYASELFLPREEITSNNPRDKDTMPSRTGKAEGTANKEIGSGEQSTTREDQVGTQ